MNRAQRDRPGWRDKKFRPKAETGPQPPQRDLRAEQIPLFGMAKALLVGGEVLTLSRRKIVYAARQKLLTGDFLNPRVFRKAAEKLLRSGDLDP